MQKVQDFSLLYYKFEVDRLENAAVETHKNLQ